MYVLPAQSRSHHRSVVEVKTVAQLFNHTLRTLRPEQGAEQHHSYLKRRERERERESCAAAPGMQNRPIQIINQKRRFFVVGY